ncbi:sulfite exporter TauE/SafE family protein [Hahella ganghwensis]|uniref:sulfite exporter TauE/SafE family protein n=1 Tax=Hahella ganghwensis TaxID=286420 RepID=UPI000374DB32|nr:sulfite exporter TauE/SafE family protein [Hahella ganghwensis]
MELIPWIISAVSLFLGCWIQTAAGFGMAVIAAPIMVLINPDWVPVTITVTALFLSIINTWNQRQHLEASRMLSPFIARLPGTAIGAWLLIQLNVAWLQVFVSACVISAVIISIKGTRFEATPTRLGIAGFVSGITGTTTSIGGPPMALIMQHDAPKTVRANLSLYFTYSCVVSLISYALTGLLTNELLWESLSFLPCALLGFYFGQHSRGFVDAGRFRPIMLWLCCISGIAALSGAIYRLT